MQKERTHNKNNRNNGNNTSAQLAGGRGGGLPCPFLKTEEKCPDFAKKSALILEKIPFLYASVG